MVITPTRERQDWGLAAVGVISSLIVDNQITDLDARAHELQYHAVAVPDGGAEQAREQINGPVEDLLEAVPPAGSPDEDHQHGVPGGRDRRGRCRSALLLIRVAAGPTICDRIVALNAMSTQAAIAVLFFAAFADRTIYCDVALWLGSFSYPRRHRLVPLPGTGAAVIEIVVIVLAAVGWAFSLSGAVGILRMPDVYTRIQCSSKMITMGALPALIALVGRRGSDQRVRQPGAAGRRAARW